MSLVTTFAAVMNATGIHPEKWVGEQMTAAIDADSAKTVASILRKHPGAALGFTRPQRGVHCLRFFEHAVASKKFNAAAAMAQLNPSVLTADYSHGEEHIRRTVLMQRTLLGDAEQVEFLLWQGMNPRERDSNGVTALHFAAGHGRPASAVALAKAGAAVDAPDYEGITPLMEATKGDTSQMVEQLLDEGAPIATCDKNGLNATMHAIHNQNIEAAMLLMRKGGAITNSNDPAIERLQRVATDEAAFDFLQLLGGQFERERWRTEAIAAQSLKKITETGTAQDITVRPIRLKGQAP